VWTEAIVIEVTAITTVAVVAAEEVEEE